MATAYVEWGSGYDCDWGVTVLDRRNYSCVLWDGIHDFAASVFTCVECGSWRATCVECGASVCDCNNAKM